MGQKAREDDCTPKHLRNERYPPNWKLMPPKEREEDD
jgi:hypothetical protein